MVEMAINVADPYPKIMLMRDEIISGNYRNIFIIDVKKAST